MSDKAEPGPDVPEADLTGIICSMLAGAAGVDCQLQDHTELLRDLNLWGDDAFAFLDSYAIRFRIKSGCFEFRKFFPCEGDQMWLSIRGFVQWRRWHDFYQPVTIADLIRIAQKHEWDM